MYNYSYAAQLCSTVVWNHNSLDLGSQPVLSCVRISHTARRRRLVLESCGNGNGEIQTYFKAVNLRERDPS